MKRDPNIILLCGEDNGRHMGCYGDAFAHTPNLDRLAASGCLFNNAFSTAPVCAPARASLVTGQHPAKIGTHLMRCRMRTAPSLFTQDLIRAGYRVNWANKTDFNFTPPEDFCTESTDWGEALAAGELNDRPFFLYFNEAVTHESGMWPPGTNDHDYVGNTAPNVLEPQQNDASLDDLSGLIVPPYLPDNRITRASLARYYHNLAQQDRTWGRLLAALEKSGVSDNTIVIYLADHGRGLVREKRWCYEAGIHQPLLVRAPEGMNLFTPGSVRDDLVSWVDIAPTILSLADVPIPESYDGRVFLGAHSQLEPECVFAGRDRMDASFDRVRVARDRRFLYIKNDHPGIPYAQCNPYMEISPVTRNVRELHVAGGLKIPETLWMQTTKPEEELYDTIADPHCVHNIAGNPEFGDTLLRLRGMTSRWRDVIADLGRVSERELLERGLYETHNDPFCNPANRQLPVTLDPGDHFHLRCGLDLV